MRVNNLSFCANSVSPRLGPFLRSAIVHLRSPKTRALGYIYADRRNIICRVMMETPEASHRSISYPGVLMPIDPFHGRKVVSAEIPRLGTIADLAELPGASPEALRSEFRRRQGVSLSMNTFVVRVSGAKDPLLRTSGGCKTICISLDFSRPDIGYCAFKWHTGLSIEEFRKFRKMPYVVEMSFPNWYPSRDMNRQAIPNKQ